MKPSQSNLKKKLVQSAFILAFGFLCEYTLIKIVNAARFAYDHARFWKLDQEVPVHFELARFTRWFVLYASEWRWVVAALCFVGVIFVWKSKIGEFIIYGIVLLVCSLIGLTAFASIIAFW